MNTKTIAALSGSLLLGLVGFAPASAQDVTMWKPVTAAGGAPSDPGFWNQQAAVRVTGAGMAQANVTIAPSTALSVYNDYSTRPSTTNVAGNQTAVNTQATLEKGGSYAVTTQGDLSFNDQAHQNNSSTTATTTALLGDNSSLTTSTSGNSN